MVYGRRGLLAALLAAAVVGIPDEAEAKRRRRKKRRTSSGRERGVTDGPCPCNGGDVCVGPRGGRYCITSGGNKRYGV